MKFKRIISALNIFLISYQCIIPAYANTSDDSTLLMLRQIYTGLNEVTRDQNREKSSGSEISIREISIEEDLLHFEKIGAKSESARQFVRELHSLIHSELLRSVDGTVQNQDTVQDQDTAQAQDRVQESKQIPDNFPEKANPTGTLHPYLQEIKVLLKKSLSTQSQRKIRNLDGNTRSDLMIFSTTIALVAAAHGVAIMHGLGKLQCTTLCKTALAGVPAAELWGAQRSFPSLQYLCQVYVGDRDSSRHSEMPRFNYGLIDEQMGHSNCAMMSISFPEIGAVLLGAALIPVLTYSAIKAHDGYCYLKRVTEKRWNTTQSSPENIQLIELFNKVEAEYGIRNLNSILERLIGHRVMTGLCFNEFGMCPLCREDFKGFEGTVNTSCAHKFHSECLELIRDNCPVCRTVLPK